MHLLPWLVVGLQTVSVYSVSTVAHAKRDDGAPQANFTDKGYTGYLCGSDKLYTIPYCSKDSDCLGKDGKNIMKPQGIPDWDIRLKYGSPHCALKAAKKYNAPAICDTELIQGKSDIEGYCKEYVAYLGEYIPGLTYVASCYLAEDDGNCDWYCDPTISQDCAIADNITFPCNEQYQIGGDYETQKKALLCPGATLPSPPPADSTKPAPGGSSTPSPADSTVPAPGGSPTPSPGDSPAPAPGGKHHGKHGKHHGKGDEKKQKANQKAKRDDGALGGGLAGHYSQ